MSFIVEFNNLFVPLLSSEGWNVLEVLFGILIVIGCLLQRAWMDIFQTSNNIISYYATKVGQIGLYGQMMMGLMSIVDGYNNFEGNTAHVMIVLWVMASTLVKYGAYLNASQHRNTNMDMT